MARPVFNTGRSKESRFESGSRGGIEWIFQRICFIPKAMNG